MPIIELRSKSTTAFKDTTAYEFKDRDVIAFYGRTPLITTSIDSTAFNVIAKFSTTAIITTHTQKWNETAGIWEDPTLDIGWIIEVLEGTSSIVSDSSSSLTIGVTEVLTGSADCTTDSTATTLYIPGVPEALSGTASIVSYAQSASVHFPPFVYLDSSAGIIITSNVSDASCVIGAPEILDSTAIIVSNVTGTLDFGLPESLSGSAFIDSTTSSPSLEFSGLARSLDATAIIVSNIVSDLTIGVVESLSGTAVIGTDSSATLQGLLIGTANITSDVGTAVIDIAMLLTRTSVAPFYFGKIDSDVDDAPLNFDFSGTIPIVSSDSTAEISNSQHLTGTADCTSVVSIPGLDVGYLKGTAAIESSTFSTTLSFGKAESLSGSVGIVSSVNGELLIVGLHDISGTVSIESDASAAIDIDIALNGTVSIESDVTGTMTPGTAWSLDASSIITTDVNGDLTIGLVTPLSSTSLIISDTAASLTFGSPEELSGTALIKNSCDGFLSFGQYEFMSSSTHIQSSASSELLIVNLVELDSSASIVSFIDSTTVIVLGRELSGSVNIQSDVSTAVITIGIIETLSGTTNIVSDTTATLDILGVSEPLSATTNITSDTTANLLLGITEPLTGTADCTSIITADLQIPGGIEVLSGTTNIVSSDSTASLTIGLPEELSGTATIDSTTGANLTVSMQATANIVSDATAVLTIGIVEELTGTCSIDSTSLGSLTIGYIEELSGSAVIDSTTTGELSFPGLAKELSHTVFADGDGYTDSYVDTDDVKWFRGTTGDFITTDTTATLEIGFYELLSGSAVITTDSTSIIDIVFGVFEQLTGSVAITTNTTSTLESPKYLYGSSDSTSSVSFALMDIDVPGKYIRRTTIGLQYWFNKFLLESELNKYTIPHPSAVDDEIIDQKSFTEMMFSDDYSWSSYRHLYRRIEDRASWPQAILQRMMLQPTLAEYFIADSDDTDFCEINLYELQSDDLRLLDKLLEYRIFINNDGTAVTIIDIDYDTLTTNLSKMIYIYLDLKINNSYAQYDETVGHDQYLLSGSADLLECMFETYLVENVFNHIVEQGT
jgi:hypothetical protein